MNNFPTSGVYVRVHTNPMGTPCRVDYEVVGVYRGVRANDIKGHARFHIYYPQKRRPRIMHRQQTRRRVVFESAPEYLIFTTDQQFARDISERIRFFLIFFSTIIRNRLSFISRLPFKSLPPILISAMSVRFGFSNSNSRPFSKRIQIEIVI